MSNTHLCVDANLVIRLIADPDDEVVRDLWETWDGERQQIAAPTLLFYEVANTLYRYHKLGLMSLAAVELALEAALALPLRVHGGPELHGRALKLAERFNLPEAHDAHYLALAECLGAEFCTADTRLSNAIQAALPWVHLAGASDHGGGQ
jgi:predicted nucleic acid-binding protein